MTNEMGGLSIGDILKNVMENPDMLKNALELAGKLKDNPEFKNIFGALNAKDGETETPQEQNHQHQHQQQQEQKHIHNGSAPPQDEAEPAFNPFKGRPSVPPKSVVPQLGKHHPKSSDRVKLLIALKPYLNQERREKIDFILKILNLIDLAEGLGIKGLI